MNIPRATCTFSVYWRAFLGECVYPECKRQEVGYSLVYHATTERNMYIASMKNMLALLLLRGVKSKDNKIFRCFYILEGFVSEHKLFCK